MLCQTSLLIFRVEESIKELRSDSRLSKLVCDVLVDDRIDRVWVRELHAVYLNKLELVLLIIFLDTSYNF